jgi:hypothetical protein
MATYVDGSFPTGSPVLTINSVQYKCNSFSTNKTASVEQIQDENGRHSGATSEMEATTGTAEVQYANINVASPTTAADNATTGVIPNVNIDGVLSTCFITGVATTKPQRGPWTSTLSFQVKVN